MKIDGYIARNDQHHRTIALCTSSLLGRFLFHTILERWHDRSHRSEIKIVRRARTNQYRKLPFTNYTTLRDLCSLDAIADFAAKDGLDATTIKNNNNACCTTVHPAAPFALCSVAESLTRESKQWINIIPVCTRRELDNPYVVCALMLLLRCGLRVMYDTIHPT